jgi:hypothetical protein
MHGRAMGCQSGVNAVCKPKTIPYVSSTDQLHQ